MSKTFKKIITSVFAVVVVALLVMLAVRAGSRGMFISSSEITPALVAVDVPPSLETPADTSGDAPSREPSSPGSSPRMSLPRLRIPSIGVSALIESVGTTPTGKMDIPLRIADVGWYKEGTPIGGIGSAVIDGHVDDTFGLPAVFAHLSDLKNNDDIYVTTTKGTELHFKVTDVSDYSLVDAPVGDIFNDTSGARLIRLITCKGSWDNGTYSYDHRVVVTAQLVP